MFFKKILRREYFNFFLHLFSLLKFIYFICNNKKNYINQWQVYSIVLMPHHLKITQTKLPAFLFCLSFLYEKVEEKQIYQCLFYFNILSLTRFYMLSYFQQLKAAKHPSTLRLQFNVCLSQTHKKRNESTKIIIQSTNVNQYMK